MAKAGKQTDDAQQQDTQTVDSVQEQIATLQQQVQEREELYRRALADYRNLQQQTQQEKIRLIQMASAGLMEEMLPTLDHLEMAMQHFKDPSLQMIADQLMQVLQAHGMTSIEAVGQPFDHLTMEAVDTAVGEKDVVVALRRQGYRLNGNVLRHAQVVVGDGTKE